MSYSTVEVSMSSGQPVELYEFIRGVSVWRFTSADRDITYSSNTYKSLAISRSSIKLNEDVFKSGISLTMHRSEIFAAELLVYSPDMPTTVTLFRGHYGDNDYVSYWKGRVVGASASGNNIEVECESVFTSSRRPGLRAHYEYNCRHALYSAKCGAPASSNKVGLKVASMISSTKLSMIGADAYANGWFSGGMIQYGGGYRFIISHTGNTLELTRPLAGLQAGATVDVYKGCDHSKETCNSKFNNIVNFGGFPWIPSKNPLGGGSIV